MRFILGRTEDDSSYAPLVVFIELADIPAELATPLLEDPRVQAWMKPSVEFPVLARILSLCEEPRDHVYSCESETHA